MQTIQFDESIKFEAMQSDAKGARVTKATQNDAKSYGAIDTKVKITNIIVFSSPSSRAE
jgi:hypothetical protein